MQKKAKKHIWEKTHRKPPSTKCSSPCGFATGPASGREPLHAQKSNGDAVEGGQAPARQGPARQPLPELAQRAAEPGVVPVEEVWLCRSSGGGAGAQTGETLI